MSKRFAKNSALFEKKNPRAAALLAFAGVKECPDETVGADVCAGCDVLVVYGLACGRSYFSLKLWLQENAERKLIVLEDDLGVIARFLEQEVATEILQDEQVHLFFIEGDETVQILQEIAWGTLGQKIGVTALPCYAKKETYTNIKNRLLYEVSNIHQVVDEFLSYGISFFRNFWDNLFLLQSARQGTFLYNKFQDIPAIIVGAGPSLDKHIDALRDLKDRALIFAGGSSVNALGAHGMRPHFAAVIDPNPTQYVRVRDAQGFEVPCFFRMRAETHAVEMLTGQKLYLPGGDGYDVQELFEKMLHIKKGGKIIDGGHNVANFLIEIAYRLGCRRVILVGFDLALTGDAAYASGVGDEKGAHTEKDKVLWQDRYGKPVYTLWKWLLEAQWISKFQKKYSKVKIYNATEGGISIPGVKDVTLEEVRGKYLQEEWDLDGLVHRAVQEAPCIDAPKEKVLQGAQRLFLSLQRTIDLLDVLISECEKNKKKSLEDIPEWILALEKLHSEEAYKYILEVFDRMRTKFDFYRLHFSKDPKKIERTVLREHYIFLKEVSIVSGVLIERKGKEYAA